MYVENDKSMRNNKCYQTFEWQKMTCEKSNFEVRDRQTEMANFECNSQEVKFDFACSSPA
jgi:hypothetical protein